MLRILMNTSGPNISLNLPIIQIITLHLSIPLFKRKLPIVLKKQLIKMQMKHEYVRPECTYTTSTRLHENFLFITCKF